MKLSNPIAIKVVALLASWLLRLWMGTLRVRLRMDDAAADPRTFTRPVLYGAWHENLLVPAVLLSRYRVASLIGQHRDGELIAQVVRMLRGSSVRGSTTRGGAAALRQLLRRGRGAHLAVTPDGPRGPRRVMQEGLVYVASRCGMPVSLVGVAFDKCWRAGSWDRMALPVPFSSVWILFGELLKIPPDLDREGIEQWRMAVQMAMDVVQRRADELAGSFPSAVAL